MYVISKQCDKKDKDGLIKYQLDKSLKEFLWFIVEEPNLILKSC